MSAQILQPLAVSFILPGGVSYRRRMDDLPNHRLAADLAQGLVAATHPHGPIRTREVASHYAQTMRRFARELHAQGFTGGLAELPTATLVRYWLGCDYRREHPIRAVLRAYQDTVGGLAEGIVRHLSGRPISKRIRSQPYRPYSDGEWERLARACTETIMTAHCAHRRALEAAERGEDPRVHGVTADNLAWLLAHHAPLATAAVRDRVGQPAPNIDQAEILTIGRALFPTAATTLAYLTLFAMRTGIVPDGIDTLTLGDITRTSASTTLLSYRKGRTGAEALNLPRDAVRLLERWLEHSALLREHAGPLADRVWIHTGGDHLGRGIERIFVQPRAQGRRRAWVRSVSILSDDGAPLMLHGGRIRATYHHRRDRSSWTGRTTIDPNHSARIEGDHYLSSHTPAQLDAIEGVIEQAQHDLRRKAAPPIVLTCEDAATFTAAFPSLVTQAGLDTSTINALLGGEQDVFLAACADPLNSPHAPPGVSCPARPWVCLLCPLAAFAPRHLPNLLRLKEYFSQQGQRMPLAQFLHVFGPYTARLDEDILPRFHPALLRDATGRSTTRPDPRAWLPLPLEEQTP
jgi:hypothetical protein